MNKVYLSIHDLAYSLDGLENILKLKEHFDNFKITCFTIPEPNEEYSKKVGAVDDVDYKEWAKMINSFDWIDIGVHGYDHKRNEMNCSYNETQELLDKSEKMFDKVGLKYKKLFVAPYWNYSRQSIKALKDRGYIIGLKHRPKRNTFKSYTHNWEFHRGLPNTDVVFGNGHITNTMNKDSIGRPRVFKNIINSIPKDTQFGFINELYAPETKAANI